MTTIDDLTLAADAPPEKLKRCFESAGLVVVKGLLSPDALSEQRAAVNRLIAIRLHSLGHAPTGEDIDGNLDALLRLDRRYAMDIIRGIKDSPFFYDILSNRKLQETSKICLGCDTLLAIHDIAQFRIDPPNDDVRNFDWHQDFPYNVMSLNAVTVWYPLKPVTEDMGPMAVVPGSHRTIVPVEMDFKDHRPGTGTMHAALRIRVDTDKAEREAVTLGEVEAGTAVFFHALLLHRSNPNRSTRSRWTVNPRFGNAADPAFASRGWTAVRDKTQGIFAQYYPEYVSQVHKVG